MSSAPLRSAVLSVLACATALPLSSHADETRATLEEIVVTAQRRETDLQSVPAAVSALTADALEAAGISHVGDLANAIPNLYIDTGSSLRATVITVRGISSNPNNPGVDPAVGVFVDGVYQGRPTTVNSAMYDIERIEFLRGPQGALYGKNTIAGAINYITRMPSQELSGDFRLGYGNYNDQTAYAAISGPLGSDRLTARLSGNYEKRDGYMKNVATGNDADNADSRGGRLTLAFDATDALKLTLRADTSRDRTRAGASEVYLNGIFEGAPWADSNPFDRRIANDRDGRGDRDQSGASLQADWDVGPGRLTSITALRKFKWTNMYDNDFTVLNMLSSGIKEDFQQVSQELRFVSKTSGKLDYVGGLYYEDQSLDTTSSAIVGPDLGVYPEEVTGIIYGDVKGTGWAAYAQGTYHFTDQFGLSAGLRYSDQKKDVTHSSVGDPYQLLLATYPKQTVSRDDSETSPSVSFNWTPSSNVLAYLSYGRGFKAGGFNVFSISPTDEASYDPEHVDSYELGLKTTLLDGAARLNIAVFKLNYDNLQVNQLVLVDGLPQYQTSNAATAESQGAEAEFSWQVTEALQLHAAYGYTDANFKSFENATAQGADYSGNVMPLAAKNAVNVSAQFATAIGSGYRLSARLEGNWRDKVFFDPSNDPIATQDSFATLDARLALTAEAGWTITLWGRNLTDETYALDRRAGVIVPGQYTHQLGAPSTCGIELGYGFK